MADDQLSLIDDSEHRGADPVRPLTQTQAAALLGVTTRRIGQIQNSDNPPPMIPDKFGRALGYSCHEYGAWLRARWTAEIGVTGDGLVLDEKTEKARLLHHQANIAQLTEATRRHKLLPATAVVEVGVGMVIAARAQVLAIPSKVRQRFPDVDSDVTDAIEELLTEALEELGSHERATDLAGRVEAHLLGMEAAAEADN